MKILGEDIKIRIVKYVQQRSIQKQTKTEKKAMY